MGTGLILTSSGWRTPERVFGGEATLGSYGVFAPAVSETDALWDTLGLRRPSVMDCVRAIRKIARRFPVDSEDAAILLDALRAIERAYGPTATEQERRALRELPLLTTRGWVRQRPVYATDDRSLADGLGDRVPIWQPGGELRQFASIVGALRVLPIDAADAEVVEPDLAEDDEERTELFREAIQQLHEDLIRNEPDLARSLTVPWERLESLSVRVHPSLTLRVSVAEDGRQRYDCAIAAKVDTDRGAVFVRRHRDLARVDRGGRALSMLFSGDSRHLAHAWRGAWDRAEEGRPATILELAQERRAREERERDLSLEERVAALRDATSRPPRPDSRAGGSKKGGGSEPSDKEESSATGTGDDRKPAPSSRELVKPSTLRLRDPTGQATESTNSGKPPRQIGGGDLVEPGGPAPPQTRTAPPNYTGDERERVGLELLEMVLGRELIDVRAKRGVGADAIDEQGRYFELKVNAGREPDAVSLTASEVMRAATDASNYILAVVSGVGGADARPTVRLVLDPLKELEPGTEDGKINLAGVRHSRSVVYQFERDNDAVGRNEEESAGSPE